MEEHEAQAALRALNGDMAALKEYVTAKDHLQYTTLPENVVALHVTHQYLKAKIVDIRLDLHMTIAEVKEKLHHHVGTSIGYMELYLRSHGEVVAPLDDDRKKLGYYGARSGMEIYIVDHDPFSLAKGGGLEDVTLVKKYEMDESEYDKRKNTVRNYKREMKAKDPNWKPPTMAAASAAGEPARPAGPDTVEGIVVGSRCEVQPGGRRGTVLYVGEVPGLKGEGHWVGVKFDEPLGLCDGTVKGTKYFDCPPKFGSFVRGWNVKTGDYPERDPFADLEDEEEEEL